MDFIDEAIREYCESHSASESELLQSLNRETHLKILSPRMLSGHLQGRFISMISRMLNPELIVEIGTYTGYSALCMAEGLKQNGRLITIDNNPELVSIQSEYFQKSAFANQIIAWLGDASSLISNLPDNIDLVFIDADKENYLKYYELILPKVRPGGYLLADNVLWSGKVVQPVKSNDHSTKAIMEFNAKIQNDPRVDNLLLPLRDGIMMIQKR